MLAAGLRISAFKTAAACWAAVESIEADYRNYAGGAAAWHSGRQCTLKQAAQKTVDRLNAKAAALTPESE